MIMIKKQIPVGSIKQHNGLFVFLKQTRNGSKRKTCTFRLKNGSQYSLIHEQIQIQILWIIPFNESETNHVNSHKQMALLSHSF